MLVLVSVVFQVFNAASGNPSFRVRVISQEFRFPHPGQPAIRQAAFAFDKVDVNSKDVIMSPDLIEHAIKTGHYKPAKAGDYSDFSFRKAYQARKAA